MNIPDELVEQFCIGNGALFVGAGLSIGAGLPSWGELISSISSELKDCPNNASYQDIAKYYSIQYGQNRLVTRIRQEIDTFNLKPSIAHMAIVKLPINKIFTTNYDDFLEQALRASGRKFNIIVTDVDSSFFDIDQLQLIKLHGDIGQPSSIIIDSGDYERYFIEHPSLARLLKVALQTSTILFIGYSASDPNFRQILTKVRVEAGELARNSFIVMFNANNWVINDLESRKIRVIDLKISEKQERNQALANWMEKLNQKIETYKQ